MLIFLFILTFLWALVATMMVIRNPFPFPDHGHRCFGVRSEQARQTVVQVIEKIGGLQERFTFDFGPTHQTLMWDSSTVINYLEDDDRLGTAISLAVSDPGTAAQEAAVILKNAGYTAFLDTTIDDGLPPNYFVLLQSDAFDGWVMAFRRPILKMPRPNIRKNK